MKMGNSPLRILVVAPFSSNPQSSTCSQRRNAMMKAGYQVDCLDTHLLSCDRSLYQLWVSRFYRWGVSLPEKNYNSLLNQKLRQSLTTGNYDVLWLDKQLTIDYRILNDWKMQNPRSIVAGYSPDDMGRRHNSSRDFMHSLPCYDIYFTTKSYNVSELEAAGCRKVIWISNAYDADFHFPREFSQDSYNRYGGEIGFVGGYEHERASDIIFLARHGLPVRVWGDNWVKKLGGKRPRNLRLEPCGLYDQNYPIAVSNFKINLCFLRKKNRDLQTTRTMEIPASGGFMLAEDSPEHRMLFQSGREAVFFSCQDELLRHCRYYLEHETERKAIAKAGLFRCRNSGYDNESRIHEMFAHIHKIRTQME